MGAASTCCKHRCILDFSTFYLVDSYPLPSNSSNLLLVICHQTLWEVDLNMSHPALMGKEINGQSDSYFGAPGSSPSHDVFQVFIQMKTFLACQTESRDPFRATELIHFH